MTTPTILGPDGVYREKFIFSTTQESRFFTGTTDSNTAEMEVSINGTAYTNDAEYITFEGTSWTVPNPEFFPDGLDLQDGVNTILVRSVSTTGEVSAAAEIEVTLADDSDLGIVASTPTNISVEQRDRTVDIRVEGLDAEGFQGFNVYASRFEGGGETGYQRINVNLITDSTVIEEIENLITTESDADAASADPLFYRVTGSQENVDGTTLQTDFSETLELDETVTTVRATYTVQSVRTIQRYSFEHDRLGTPDSDTPTIPVGDFAALGSDDLLYYVVSAVFYDEENRIEFESAYSPEVVGRPLRVTATLGNFPSFRQGQVATQLANSILRSNAQVRVDKGSGIRDVTIDPVATEAEKIRFIYDFLHRAQIPSQLLAIDDPQGTGESVAVESSSYKLALKQAFLLSSNQEVQLLIDSMFESYASKFGVYRSGGRAARGEVTFFTRNRPTRTLNIPLGTIVQGGSQQFITTQSASIDINSLASSFNPITGRYQVTVPIRAAQAGSAGVVAAGQIRRIVSTIPGLSVINNSKTFGGENTQSNRDLVEEARRKLSSVDSGTKQGILQLAADVPGVERAKVVVHPNPLMQRDLDGDGVHRGGKVDVWVQGTNLATVTDTFAFTFDLATDIQFQVFGDPGNLRFRSLDPALSETNPIVEMLDFPSQGYELVNATTGETFDLTNVTIESYDTIVLDTDLVQPSVALTDVILGSYRRRAGTEYILSRQPVTEVVSVTGAVSGEFPDDAFTLVHPDSPLIQGRSGLAQSYLLVTPFTNDDGEVVPATGGLTATDEPHVLLDNTPEPLDNLGASFLSIVVTSEDGLTTYRGPNDPSGTSDYTIILGDATTPVSIQKTSSGAIPDGATVLVSYEYDENFTVTYTTNLTVSVVQEDIDAKKNVTADILVKDAVPVPIDIQATVVLNQGAAADQVDRDLRTNFTNYLSNLRLGDPFRQSDAVNIIEQTEGVSYVVVPLTQMSRQQGSQVVREALNTDLAADVEMITNLSTASVGVWLLKDELKADTTNGGGSTTEFRGVFEDDLTMDLLDASSSFSALSTVAGRAYIIGEDGAVIFGYSDDSTLAAAGVAAADRAARRRELTANRILVSVLIGDTPVNHEYAATYVVGDDTGVKNILPGDAEYITVGNLFFTKDED